MSSGSLVPTLVHSPWALIVAFHDPDLVLWGSRGAHKAYAKLLSDQHMETGGYVDAQGPGTHQHT